MKLSIQNVLAYDRAVPQRDLLLDDAQVGEYLRTSSELRALESCEKLRVKYRVGQSLRVTYKVYAQGEESFVTCRTFDSSHKVLCSNNGNGDFLTSSDLNAAFWMFPNDRKIKGLERLTEPDNSQFPAWAESKLVAYAPEKCATFQCLDVRGNVLAYAKVYADGEASRVASIYRHLAQAGFPAPKALHAEPDIIFVEPVEGNKIVDLEDAELLEGIQGLGKQLARLHSIPPSEGMERFTRHSVSNVGKAIEIIGTARPDILGLSAKLQITLLSNIPENDQTVLLHGDVHPKNALLGSQGLRLIDFDQAAIGHPASDIGSYLASLKYLSIIGELSEPEEKSRAEAFIAGYSSAGDLPEQQAIAWHVATSLLTERTLRAVNRIRPEGLEKMEALLLTAIQIAAGDSAQ